MKKSITERVKASMKAGPQPRRKTAPKKSVPLKGSKGLQSRVKKSVAAGPVYKGSRKPVMKKARGRVTIRSVTKHY